MLDLTRLVGLTITEALVIASPLGYAIRIVTRDGQAEALPHPNDSVINEKRINVHVIDGKILKGPTIG